jgi:hypothetical protein
MDVCCPESTDAMFPMLADIYYPIVEQGAFGNVEKQWVLDRTITCNFNGAGTAWKEDIKPNVAIIQDSILLGRTKTDLRISSLEAKNAVTNVIVTNIRDKSGNHIYTETAGPRVGKSTIFEIATLEPFVGPFGDIEYYKVVVRRSENQAANL